MDLGGCVRPTLDGAVLVDIEVQPGASRQGVVGFNPWRNRISVAVSAQAVQGRANRAVLAVLQAQLGCQANETSIVTGHTSRQKTVRLESVPMVDLVHRLTKVLEAVEA